MRLLQAGLLLFLAFGSLFAQKTDTIPAQAPFRVLKTSPLSIFDLDNSLTLGFEQSISVNKSIQVEAGYGNSNWNLWKQTNDFNNSRDEFRDFNIFRLRTEWRRYRFADVGSLPEGNYIAVEGFFKYVGKNDFFRVGREVINSQPTYFEFVEGNKRKIVGGTHVKLGRQSFIFNDNPNKEPRFLLDFYIGLGFRVVDYRFKYDNQKPNDTLDFRDNRLFGTIADVNEVTPLVSGTLGFKLGYLLY